MAEMFCRQLLLMNLLRMYCSRASYHAISSPGWVHAHLCIHASFKRMSVTQSHVDISDMILCTCICTYVCMDYAVLTISYVNVVANQSKSHMHMH